MPAASAHPGSYDAPATRQTCRPPRSESRARSQLINLRVNADERERWGEFARSHGLSVGGLLRLSVEFVMAQQAATEVQR